MTILYVATDQTVPGATGGSVHVQAVAEGLAARGQTVHVAARPGPGGFPSSSKVSWHALEPPMGIGQLRWLRAGQVVALARRLGPRVDVIMERYYNFGGEGMIAARRTGARAVLEVNAPIVDYPGSPKRTLDRLTLVQPLRRWREWQCRVADLIVTPSARIVPAGARGRVLEIEWGADTERFRPHASGPAPFEREPDDVIAVFVGAFRRWHGTVRLVAAIRKLRARGHSKIKAVLIGAGPELAAARAEAEGVGGVIFTGALPHDRIPAALAAADIGVAPFDASVHPPLAIDFYWSPLKIFEYMAAGLPVVAPDLPRLREIVRPGQDGLLYDPEDPEGLVNDLARLEDETLRGKLGGSARERVVTHFSWAAHCQRLETAIVKLAAGSGQCASS
ncbi:MAG: glycosyltransferase family 4 protein [Acidobacteria bacterium]|nr:glycosyltransferase family 4 protein [Acidobacteriota bacterium]MBI3263989.1 glycosyltransferase family 4 protein [Acidobacteriota bacterium]